jgi:hypothetical protein
VGTTPPYRVDHPFSPPHGLYGDHEQAFGADLLKFIRS